LTELRRRFEQNLGGILLVLVGLGCLLVVRPFFFAILMAIVLCLSTWPLYQRLLNLLGGRRSLAALLMCLAMALVVLLPFAIVGLSVKGDVAELTSAARQWLDAGPPAPPSWLAKVPWVGERVTRAWVTLVSDTTKLRDVLKSSLETVAGWLLQGGLILGQGLIELTLSLFVAFFVFRDGLKGAGYLTRGVDQVAGERGTRLLDVATKTARGVVYGILGTAMVQAVMAGIGLLIAGVPGALVLAMLTFFLSVVPVGPPLIWLPAALWLFHSSGVGWGIFMLVWGAIAVSGIDNVVKPWLISQGSELPFVLIFLGVLGGVMAFGFIGVVLGPTLLSVGYQLAVEWAGMREGESRETSM
jgi:predicted PurR-regulated permease PerM